MHRTIVEHTAHEAGYTQGYDQGYEHGKKFAQKKALELMNEVIEKYKLLARQEKMGQGLVAKSQLNAAGFMKHWVMSGGHEDEEGNRVCLPW
jgi:hypothetical protein